ncbi:hypothetical protein [Pseudomonas sichuanensis]|uniref:hypothetical protein n=1 Tax=Pseudomonas sichuanensis TaxID=2213015 RepID=UPI00215F0B41|nr:hypothetical protein [Pseudomonas sichuanensis]UVL92024.1 hypothetical protein LOY51_15890 [Pseudomonas sichuanensis]
MSISIRESAILSMLPPSRASGLAVTTPLYWWLASRDSAYRRSQVNAKLAAGV